MKRCKICGFRPDTKRCWMSHKIREMGEGSIGDITKRYCGKDEKGEYKSRWHSNGMTYHQVLIDMGLLELKKINDGAGIGYAANTFRWLKDYEEGAEEIENDNGDNTEDDEISGILIRIREAEVESIIEKNPLSLLPELEIIGRQVTTPVGRIDLLGKIDSILIVIEIKAEKKTSDSAVGQLSRYGGWAQDAVGKGDYHWATGMRCILVISDKLGENLKLESALGFIGESIEVKRYETQIVFS